MEEDGYFLFLARGRFMRPKSRALAGNETSRGKRVERRMKRDSGRKGDRRSDGEGT